MKAQIFKIRKFGQDTTCSGLIELKDKIKALYRGTHISVETINSRGMKSVKYLSISETGYITESYSNNVFDLASLEEKESA
jgi:hypothetical protein